MHLSNHMVLYIKLMIMTNLSNPNIGETHTSLFHSKIHEALQVTVDCIIKNINHDRYNYGMDVWESNHGCILILC